MRRGKIALGALGLMVAAASFQGAIPSGSEVGGRSSLRRDAAVEILVSSNALPIRLDVEVADETSEQDRGLMDRRLAGDGEGMLFVYPNAKPRIFWMRDTPVPLDLLFFDSDLRLVALIAKAEPLSDRLLKSHVPAQYVLEVPGGFSSRHSVHLGAEIRIVKGGSIE